MFAQQQHDRRRFFSIVALSLAGAWIGTRDSVMHMITVKPFRLSSASDLASLGGATAWLNSAPLTAADLQGKVVLVDFGPTPASIGFAHCHTSAPGPRGTKNKGWSSSACTHQNSRLRQTSTTCERPQRREASRIPLPSTTTARSGVGSVITIGRRSTSSMRKGACAITTSAKVTTKNQK